MKQWRGGEQGARKGTPLLWTGFAAIQRFSREMNIFRIEIVSFSATILPDQPTPSIVGALLARALLATALTFETRENLCFHLTFFNAMT
jgi:hypothetical protein